jgi:hypothetical protein
VSPIEITLVTSLIKDSSLLEINYNCLLYSLTLLEDIENILIFSDGNSDTFIFDLNDLRLLDHFNESYYS